MAALAGNPIGDAPDPESLGALLPERASLMVPVGRIHLAHSTDAEQEAPRTPKKNYFPSNGRYSPSWAFFYTEL